MEWYIQNNETRPPTYTIHQNKLKMNKRSDTIEVLEENIGRKISDIPHRKSFANICSMAREIKEIIHKWDYIKLKISTAKENITKVKRELTAWEKYLPMIPQTAV